MRKLIIITKTVLILATILIAIITVIGESKLSDETLKIVETLRNKHYFNGMDITELLCSDDHLVASQSIEWNLDFLSLWVENGKLFIETQDGKWFIEMKEIKERG